MCTSALVASASSSTSALVGHHRKIVCLPVPERAAMPSIAVELAPIRVNGVSPGLVDTPRWSGIPEDVRREYFARVASKLPSRKVATADEIAEVVAMAATNRATTGTVIEADGGARLVSLG